jgi:WD40 repeat protein
VAHLEQKGHVWGVSFSPDGQYLATASEDKSAAVYRTNGSKVRDLGHDEAVWAVAFSNDGKYLATRGRGGARIFNTTKWQEVWPSRRLDPVVSVAFSPDGQFLAIATLWEGVLVLDLRTGNEAWHVEHNGAGSRWRSVRRAVT